MCDLVLLSSALNIPFEGFKIGMARLNSIERYENHNFHKHESVYSLQNFISLCSETSFDSQAIMKFIVQLQECPTEIINEIEAKNYFLSDKNSFMGIDFSKSTITSIKQIVDKASYKKWSYHILSAQQKLEQELGTCILSNVFLKDFNNSGWPVQESIIDEFKKARNRNLATPYYPDTKIVKDVTPTKNKCKVMELRVYTPVALRVYFHESSKGIKIGSMDQKSNANQNSDINKAHQILSNL